MLATRVLPDFVWHMAPEKSALLAETLRMPLGAFFVPYYIVLGSAGVVHTLTGVAKVARYATRAPRRDADADAKAPSDDGASARSAPSATRSLGGQLFWTAVGVGCVAVVVSVASMASPSWTAVASK